MNANHPNGFSLERALDLGQLSSAAYLPHLVGTGLAVLEDGRWDTRAVIVRYDEHTELAFRGTVDLKNWLLNLDVRKTALAYRVAVHTGFLKAGEELFQLILAELLPAGADKSALKPIYVTGHSLGGALAVLVAFFLQREGFPVAGVYTFASPRVGNAAWRRDYTRLLGLKTYRVIATGDLVPLVPGVLDDYRHVGIEIMLERGGRLVARPPHWHELLLDGLACAYALERLDFDAVIRNHSLDQDYLPRLDTANARHRYRELFSHDWRPQ